MIINRHIRDDEDDCSAAVQVAIEQRTWSSRAAASRWATVILSKACSVSWPRCIFDAVHEARQAAQLCDGRRHAVVRAAGQSGLVARRVSCCLCGRRCGHAIGAARPATHRAGRHEHPITPGDRIEYQRASSLDGRVICVGTIPARKCQRADVIRRRQRVLIVPPRDARYPAGTQLEAMLAPRRRRAQRRPVTLRRVGSGYSRSSRRSSATTSSRPPMASSPPTTPTTSLASRTDRFDYSARTSRSHRHHDQNPTGSRSRSTDRLKLDAGYPRVGACSALLPARPVLAERFNLGARRRNAIEGTST